MSEENLIKTIIQAASAGMEAIRSVVRSDLQTEQKADWSPVTEADRRSHKAIQWILSETGIPVVSEEGADIPFSIRKDYKLCWMVDPLDGTKEFIKGSDEYTINIALLDQGKPILGLIAIPERNLFYLGSKSTGAIRFNHDGIDQDGWPSVFDKLPEHQQTSKLRVIASRSHLNDSTANYIEQLRKKHGELDFVQAGSALKFCLLAEGNADVYPRFSPCMEWDTAAGHVLLNLCGKKLLAWPGDEELVYNKENLLNPDFIAI